MIRKILDYEKAVSNDRHTGEKYGGVLMKLNTESHVIVSAPHSVRQLRDGAIKSADVNTYGLAMLLHELTGASVVTLSGYCGCDPNYDYRGAYKNTLRYMAGQVDVKLVLDLHGCRDRQPYFDICLATDNDKSLLGRKSVKEMLLSGSGLTVEDNTYFKADGRDTVANYCYSRLEIPAVELELSSTARCTDRVDLLVGLLCDVIGRVESRAGL